MNNIASKISRNKRHCTRSVKWRNRRRQTIGGLLSSVHDLNGTVYEAAEELMQTRNQLVEARNEMKAAQSKVERLKRQVGEKTINLQTATTNLQEAVKDLQSPHLHNLNEDENMVLKIDLWMAEEDIVEAWNHIHDAEDDLNYETLKQLVEEPKEQHSSNDEGVRNFSSITLPNVVKTGIIPVNGVLKANRNKCCICLEAKIECVMYKCGHLSTCYPCTLLLKNGSRENRKCPVCRQTFKDFIKVYWA